MFDLMGRTVLVTGGSRGIGAACVRIMNQAGAHVVLHYSTNKSAAQETANQCSNECVHTIQADFSDSAGATTLWKEALQWKGSIDVLVNNAGIMTPTPLESSDDDWHFEWKKILQVNLIAVADLCREAIKHFQMKNGGVIINIASRSAFRGDDKDYMHYSASKAGLVALSKTIARNFAKDKILVYTIAPGFVDTELNSEFLKKFGKDALLNGIPLGQFATSEEIAHTVAFLATGLIPSATGTNIDINGASYVR